MPIDMEGTQTSDHKDSVPLVLDVDGTVLRTDLLYETFWAALGRDFWRTTRVCLASWRSPARLKRDLVSIATPEIELLPFRQDVVDKALAAQKSGRPVHLASGSDQTLVDAVADYLGLEGEHFGSNPECNLTASTKAAVLVDSFGENKFDYAGNSRDDLEPWKKARRIIAVSPGATLSARLEALGKPVETIRDGWQVKDLLHEMRPHQWVKNLLLFLPLLAAHRLEPGAVLSVFLAVVAFSLAASSIYILNDLLDLDADRRHPEKRNRPIASGRLPIRTSMLCSVGLGVIALTIAYVTNPLVALMTFGYMMTTLVYSLCLKHIRWVDILTLAFLFLLRVLTGAVASQTMVSGWLLGIVLTVFIALAIAKRSTGLSRAFRGGHLPGRGYDQNDVPSLRNFAYASILATGIQFLIYTSSTEAGSLYASQGILALAVIPVVLWLVRVIRLSELGREDYDPVVFVIHDRPGLLLAGAGLAIIFLAI